jgi:hypothetical protein
MTSHPGFSTSWMQHARADQRAGRLTLRRLLFENALSLVISSLFFICWFGQALVGLYVYNDEQNEHGQPTVTLLQYLTTGHFAEATAENWESEFLQMAAFVWFTSFLFQKGSPESKDPYEPDEVLKVTADSPWPARRGGWVLKLYENSLSLAFLVLFVLSFVLHAVGGAAAYSHEQSLRGESDVTVWQYLGTSQFWFESLQNWQSEFLSIGAMVVLAIFLRQRGSAESKAVETPHSQNE